MGFFLIFFSIASKMPRHCHRLSQDHFLPNPSQLINSWAGTLESVRSLAYGLDGRDSVVRLPAATRDFSSYANCLNRFWGPSNFLKQYRETIAGEVNRPRSDADHPPPFGAEVRNEWSYTSFTSYLFVACTRTNLTLFINRNIIRHFTVCAKYSVVK
jgi:hypothetical protein